MRILIAEDDAVSNLKLELTLEKWGYTAVTTFDGFEAWEVLRAENPPPVAIIDIMMPQMDGIELCRKVRELPRIIQPYLILLTAKTSKEDVVTGLAAGANDYVTKPFDPDELRARVQVGQQMVELQATLAERVTELEDALARANHLQELLSKDTHVYSFGPFVLDAGERRLSRDGHVLPLSTKVFDTLLLLVQNSGHLIEKKELIAELWPDSFVEENNLTVNISSLRKALNDSHDDHSFIETIPKRGYRFIAPVTISSARSSTAPVRDTETTELK